MSFVLCSFYAKTSSTGYSSRRTTFQYILRNVFFVISTLNHYDALLYYIDLIMMYTAHSRMCTHTHTHSHTCTTSHITHTHTHAHAHAHAHVQTNTRMHTHTLWNSMCNRVKLSESISCFFVCMFVCLFVCLSSYSYVCLCVYVFVWMCVCVPVRARLLREPISLFGYHLYCSSR